MGFGKRGVCATGIVGPWVAVMGVSVAAQLLDGIIPLCCKLTHARTHAPATPQTGAKVTLHPILAQWDQDVNGGMQFDVLRVRTTCPANIDGILRTQVMRELLPTVTLSFLLLSRGLLVVEIE
jgi:hypothetical protein